MQTLISESGPLFHLRKSCPTFGMHKEIWRKTHVELVFLHFLTFKYLTYFLKAIQNIKLFKQEIHQGHTFRA